MPHASSIIIIMTTDIVGIANISINIMCVYIKAQCSIPEHGRASFREKLENDGALQVCMGGSLALISTLNSPHLGMSWVGVHSKLGGVGLVEPEDIALIRVVQRVMQSKASQALGQFHQGRGLLLTAGGLSQQKASRGNISSRFATMAAKVKKRHLQKEMVRKGGRLR